MSGTLPKSADASVSQKEKKPETKKKKEDGVIGVSPLPLSEIDAHSVQESNGNDDAEEEEEEEVEEVEEEEEEPLPPGWSEEIYADRVKFYWSVRHGKVSLDRPVGEKSEGDEGSIHSQQQTARTNESIPSTSRSQKTTGGSTTDRRNNQSVDEFEKLLRAQMLDRQLKEVLRLGDKELLRAVIVRYEDSKKPSGEQQRNDDDGDDDDDDACNGLLQRSKELLKSVDYYYHRLREQMRRGHWLQALSTGTAGAGGGKGQRAGGGGGGTRGRGAGGKGAGVIAKETPGSRFYKLLEKFDRLNSQTEQQRYDQEDEDVCWLRETVSTEVSLRREDVLDDIDSLLKELRRKPDPRRPGPHERTKGPTHGAPKRGPHSSGPSNHSRYDEDEEGEDEEEREEAERLQRELQILKRVRQFLQQQIDHVDLMGQALRPRDNSLPILAMDKKTMAEIRSYASPKPIVHRVMQAALLLIGYDEATTAVWSNCKSACVPDGRDGLNRRLMKLNVEALHPFIVERSWKILHRIRLEDVQKASPGAATFYVWASGVLRMQGYSIDDDTLEGESNDGKMTQREIVRREQNTLRKPVTSHDDYGNEGYHDERPTYPGALYNI